MSYDIKNYLRQMIDLEKELDSRQQPNNVEYTDIDPIQDQYNSNYISNSLPSCDVDYSQDSTVIEPVATPEDEFTLDSFEDEDYEEDYDSIDGCVDQYCGSEEIEPMDNASIDRSQYQQHTPSEQSPQDIVAWADTTNFIISAKRLSEFLGEVLYNPDKYIATIEGYEDYMPTGAYYITGMTSTQGMIVSLTFENMNDELIFVNVILNDEGVEIHSVKTA